MKNSKFLTINQILKNCIYRLDYAKECTDQTEDESKAESKGWFLIKNGKKHWFHTIDEIVEYLDITKPQFSRLKHGNNIALKNMGWSLIKVEEYSKRYNSEEVIKDKKRLDMMRKGLKYTKTETGVEYFVYDVNHPTLGNPGKVSMIDDNENRVTETFKAFQSKYVCKRSV